MLIIRHALRLIALVQVWVDWTKDVVYFQGNATTPLEKHLYACSMTFPPSEVSWCAQQYTGVPVWCPAVYCVDTSIAVFEHAARQLTLYQPMTANAVMTFVNSP